MKQSKPKEAFEAYKKCAETDPNYANAYFGMASCQKNFKEYENALKNYNKFLESFIYLDSTLLTPTAFTTKEISMCV